VPSAAETDWAQIAALYFAVHAHHQDRTDPYGSRFLQDTHVSLYARLPQIGFRPPPRIASRREADDRFVRPTAIFVR
jgi:hypothetical protein